MQRCSNPFPFLLWIATLFRHKLPLVHSLQQQPFSIFIVDCDRATSSHTLYDKQGSNPFPFLLWIATFFVSSSRNVYSSGSNPFPFLLWIATATMQLAGTITVLGSNPFPFLLWIATFGEVPHDVGIHSVVTLFHFYCGLRQQRIKLEGEALAAFVVTLFHFYCGLRLFCFIFMLGEYHCSNPFPFLLWIATINYA